MASTIRNKAMNALIEIGVPANLNSNLLAVFYIRLSQVTGGQK